MRSAWEQVGVLTAGGDAPAGRRLEQDRAGPAGTPSGAGPRRGPGRRCQVLLRRTGGFAGLVRERRVALGDLPERDTQDWQHLLARRPSSASRPLPRAPHPDAYFYSVVCDEAGRDVTIHEPHLPEAIHSLFERTLADD